MRVVEIVAVRRIVQHHRTELRIAGIAAPDLRRAREKRQPDIVDGESG